MPVNSYPNTLAEFMGTMMGGQRKIRLGEIGIDGNDAVMTDAPMQLILVQSSTWTVTDDNDPLGRPASSSHTTQLYAAQGRFASDPDYSGRTPGGAIDSGYGTFNVYGEVNSKKDKFTNKTYTELTAVFSGQEGTTSKKSFYVGVVFSEDTIAEMQPVDIVRVVPDTYMDCVVLTVQKRSQR